MKATILRLKCAAVLGLAMLLISQMVGTAKADGHERVIFQMGWWHEHTYAGYYAAAREGQYSAAGLEVEFIEGGPGINSLSSLANGVAQFTTTTASAVLSARAKGSPIVAVACFYRRSPLAFVTKLGSAIRHPKDFAGKTIRIAKHSVPILNAMTAPFGLNSDAYRIVHTRKIDKFYSGEIDVWGGYLAGALLRAQKKKAMELNIIHPDNFGVHTYHNCLTTTEMIVEKRPDLIRRFLSASVWGWSYVVTNPSRVGTLVSSFSTKASADEETEKFLLSLPLIDTGEDSIGWMKPKIWTGIAKAFIPETAGANEVVSSEAYTLRFLREAADRQ